MTNADIGMLLWVFLMETTRRNITNVMMQDKEFPYIAVSVALSTRHKYLQA